MRSAPQFKPDYAPALLLSFMYIGHVFSVRRSLFNELGGFRKAFDGSQDYDFALRAVERARHVGHVPKVLYSWRIAPGSTAASADAKPESFEAGRKAVEGALIRRGAGGSAVHPEWARAAKCGIFSVDFPDTGPAVTLIIPTRDKLDLLRPCVESLSKTTYRNFQIMIVDNDSQEPETATYLANLTRKANVRVERISNEGRAFSYARINNEAVRRAQTEFVLLLNNDTEVREPRWLSQMMGQARMQGVGAVGAKLLFGDGTVQHAGIVHGMYDGMAGPAFRNRDCHDWGYLNFLKVSREYAAVTAACLLMRKSLYEQIGGLDEKRFNVAYNDVDLCYRI
ncbi:MAG: glycosyltransferase, partial [Terricaulis sp.]